MAYSNDLRLRAVTYFRNNNLQYRDVAAIFDIGVATMHDWVKRFEETGKVEKIKSSGRPRVLPAEKNDAFKELVSCNADKTLAQLSEKWHEAEGQKLSIFCVSRSIRRVGFSYKKNFSGIRAR
jgi:transposase